MQKYKALEKGFRNIPFTPKKSKKRSLSKDEYPKFLVNSKTEKRLLGETTLKLKEIEASKDQVEKMRLRRQLPSLEYTAL